MSSLNLHTVLPSVPNMCLSLATLTKPPSQTLPSKTPPPVCRHCLVIWSPDGRGASESNFISSALERREKIKITGRRSNNFARAARLLGLIAQVLPYVSGHHSYLDVRTNQIRQRNMRLCVITWRRLNPLLTDKRPDGETNLRAIFRQISHSRSSLEGVCK